MQKNILSVWKSVDLNYPELGGQTCSYFFISKDYLVASTQEPILSRNLRVNLLALVHKQHSPTRFNIMTHNDSKTTLSTMTLSIMTISIIINKT